MSETLKFNSQENNNVDQKKEKMKDKKIENLQTLKDFFNLNLKIKENLLELAPPSLDDLDYGDGISYEKKINKNIGKLVFLFQQLAEKLTKLNLPGEKINFKVKNLVKKIENDILNKSKWDFNNLVAIYKENFSNMDEKLIKEISREMVGFYMMKLDSFKNILDRTQSFNEVLHLAHSLVVSDEKIYSKLPQWKNQIKENKKIKCGLYGEKNEHAERIVSYFQEQQEFWKYDNLEIPAANMNLLSFEQNIQMMVRDFGHALIVNIDLKNENSAFIRYNIPKIFDGQRVSQLPGINQIGKNSQEGASGQFETNYNNLARDIFELVVRVPTDENYKKNISLDFIRSKDENLKNLKNKIKGVFSAD